MEEKILLEIKDQIAHITLNRPEKHNGVDLDMLTSLISTAQKIRKDKRIRVVVLSGNGPSFCSGLDFASVTKKPLKIIPHFVRSPFQYANNFQKFAWAFYTLPVPVISAIHGNCFGAGLQLALASDLRFSTPDAKLSVFEINWGIIPDMSGTLTLRDLVRADIAKDLVFTGRMVTGTEAAQIGLVTASVADPIAQAYAYAQEITQKSPDAIISAKKILNKNRHSSSFVGLLRERLYQAWLFLTPNQRIAMKAGLSKSTPIFKDRIV